MRSTSCVKCVWAIHHNTDYLGTRQDPAHAAGTVCLEPCKAAVPSRGHNVLNSEHYVSRPISVPQKAHPETNFMRKNSYGHSWKTRQKPHLIVSKKAAKHSASPKGDDNVR